MKRILGFIALAVAVLAVSPVLAAEKTVTLKVDNMYCAACPYIVKESLASVQGVKSVDVSYKEKTAIVVFNDDETDVAALTDATFDAGYPSEPYSK